MAKLLDRIWIRFGLGIAATVVVTMTLLVGGILVLVDWQFQSFYRDLPVQIQQELNQLAHGATESPRLVQIYSQYWRGDPLFGERWAIVFGLLICLPVGLGVGFWISRTVTLPLASMAQAVHRIGMGDFSVRAKRYRERGEMAEMLHDFNRMADALQNLENQRRTSAAALSHELRTPLAVLTARLHALRDGVIGADTDEFDRLLGQVHHLSRLVDDMHTLAMAEAGRLSLHLCSLDLVALAKDVVETFSERAQRFRVELHVNAGIRPVLVRADADRLRQVLSNLLDNALRHAVGAQRVDVDVHSVGTDAVLTVADDGPGLPLRIRQDPFERFQSAGTRGSGSGLGLSIVKALVVRHEGSVWTESGPASGARFYVRLPLEM